MKKIHPAIKIIAIILSVFALIFINNYTILETSDVKYYTSGKYKKVNGGKDASQFLPELKSLEDYSDIKFAYADGNRIISLHKYRTFFILDIKYSSKKYNLEKERLFESINLENKNYEMGNYKITIVNSDEKIFQDNYACICYNDSSCTIRYLFYISYLERIIQI